VNLLNKLKRTSLIILAVILVLLGSTLLVGFIYQTAVTAQKLRFAASTPDSNTPISATSALTPTSIGEGTSATSTLPPVQDPRSIMGISSDPYTFYPGIRWVRLSYPTCGSFHLYYEGLRHMVRVLHSQGVRILFVICQQSGNALLDPAPFNDVASSGVDAVQCGNEQMKYDPPATDYVKSEDFAKFYDLCERIIHAARPEIPVLLGTLDPHVGGIDYQPLLNQVSYLDAMQNAMNTSVHPGGNWSWRSQIVGLIDSWHNGYPNDGVNSLYHLFVFWAQQFHVNLNSGQLGKHLWVSEGTGCFKDCGLDQNNAYQVAVSHILTLITDVQTALHYGVPFFYFSGRDFLLSDGVWPIGILDMNGHPKALRQDLALGARSLTMSCSTGEVKVIDQEQLLAKLYSGCSLPANYLSVLTS